MIARSLVLALSLLCAARAVTPEALARATKSFQQANAAYEKSDYAKASDLYRQALDEGVADSRLYFNYANCLFRQNQLGMSILIDSFGWLGNTPIPFSTSRLLAAVLLAIALWFIYTGSEETSPDAPAED